MTLPKSLVARSKHPLFVEKMEEAARYNDEVSLYDHELTNEVLEALRDVAQASDQKPHKGLGRVADAILRARNGDFDKSIPRLDAAPEILLAYFRDNLDNGWIYRRGADGHLHAWLVTEVKIIHPRHDDKPFLSIDMTANGSMGSRRHDNGAKSLGETSSSLTLTGDKVVRRKVSALLSENGCYIETPALREEYEKGLAHYVEVLGEGFSEQYRYSGTPLAVDDWRKDGPRQGHKVIHDLRRDEINPPQTFAASVLFNAIGGDKVETALKKKKILTDDGGADHGYGPMPTHFGVRVFDLHTQDYFWANALDMKRYVYDPTLREKIVLPEDQRNLLDILTSDLDSFTGDVIEGKSTGNVVLCKGSPGVGKTLTAEVYSELIERPLYSIHSGNLGVQADEVRKNLETSFARAKRWNAVLLLDEADVFVLERGENITQNAIVAEFLRTLEYFDGLMFMTTNRANNIDDAILSRAAAIIDYPMPDRDGIRQVWLVQAKNQGVEIDPALLDEMVHGFVVISPRDVKMLLRLALRVAKGNDTDLSIEIIAKCAMFRGLHFEKGARA